MKYLRKLITTLIIVIFLSSVVIGAGVILAVKNVNITLETYTFADKQEGAQTVIDGYKQKILDKYRGNLIYGVDEKDIEELIDGDYSLVKFEKILPCTINLTLRERKETFAIIRGETYNVYDETGTLLDEGLAEIDPYDILVDIKNGETIESVAAICGTFKEEFSALRAILKKVECLDASYSSMPYSNRIIFNFNSGLTLDIRDYNDRLKEKVEAAYGVYSSLSGDKKLKGTIICSIAEGDTVNAIYS